MANVHVGRPADRRNSTRSSPTRRTACLIGGRGNFSIDQQRYNG
jgi:hypothetical protein